MKKIIFFLPFISLLIFSENKILLESAVIKMADGSLINADKIEFILKFRRKLFALIIGEQTPNNQRKGKYFFKGSYHGIESLARIEEEIKIALKEKKDKAQQSALQELLFALQELLTQAKADFIVQSAEFIESGRGAKNIMTILIQEDCIKRNRIDSQLLEWAKTKEGQESTMFERQITSFGLYYRFLMDLVNFLLDLTHSCPKAELQFKDRVAKWSAVKEILPAVFKKAHVKTDHVNENDFLKYLKERYLDQIPLAEINPQVIVPLLAEYIRHT